MSASVPQPSIQRWKCICAYDGASFAGWQSQVGGNSVQDTIERRLKEIFGTLIRIHGSGRTDAGVHARGQVFHFDAPWRHGSEKLLAAIRGKLPLSIQIRSVEPVSEEFHARFSAKRKRYVYHIHLGDPDPFTRPYCWPVFGELDVEAMQTAAAVLRGSHDFRAFTAVNGPEREDTRRDLKRLDVVRRGPNVRIIAEADGFMYKMVRSLAGVLVAAGVGKLTGPDVARILAGRQRTPEVQTAPAQGLFLEKVYYR